MLHVSRFLEYVDPCDPETSTIKEFSRDPEPPMIKKENCGAGRLSVTQFNIAKVIFLIRVKGLIVFNIHVFFSTFQDLLGANQ